VGLTGDRTRSQEQRLLRIDVCDLARARRAFDRPRSESGSQDGDQVFRRERDWIACHAARPLCLLGDGVQIPGRDADV
jgi:hypothetical protein